VNRIAALVIAAAAPDAARMSKSTALARLPSPARAAADVGDRVAHAIVHFLGHVPDSDLRRHADPDAAAREEGLRAARRAALAAGTMALPPGALGWLTVLPEMVGVWHIQAQLVADIARLYGRSATVTPEQVMYCLFRHSAAQAVRDLAVRTGERLLVRQASVRVIQVAARKIGLKLSQRAIARAVARWIPVAGAVGVGAYAYYDTREVGRTAAALFAGEVALGAARDSA
jgi:hypothetical protein